MNLNRVSPPQLHSYIWMLSHQGGELFKELKVGDSSFIKIYLKVRSIRGGTVMLNLDSNTGKTQIHHENTNLGVLMRNCLYQLMAGVKTHLICRTISIGSRLKTKKKASRTLIALFPDSGCTVSNQFQLVTKNFPL